MPQLEAIDRTFRSQKRLFPKKLEAMITTNDLERRLAGICEGAGSPVEGVFGPGSRTWRVDREAALFIGAERALLLQLAHPWVAKAITDHSTTLADPIGRFHRTFGVMFSLVFGTRDQALAASRRLHARHATVSGQLLHAAGPFAADSAYEANDASALLWVHATLVDTALAAHDTVLPPLGDADRERYYDESRRLAALYGIPEDVVPPDWSAFQRYIAGMLDSGTITVTAEARMIADALLGHGARWWLRPPRWYRAVTSNLLPPRIREGFAIAITPPEMQRADRAIRHLRRVYPRLPARLRFVGPYHEATERVMGRASPTLLTRASNRLWIGRSQLSPRPSEP